MRVPGVFGVLAAGAVRVAGAVARVSSAAGVNPLESPQSDERGRIDLRVVRIAALILSLIAEASAKKAEAAFRISNVILAGLTV